MSAKHNRNHVEQQDLLNLHFPSNPSFSPEGHIAYRVSRPNARENKYDSHIWVYDIQNGTHQQLTFFGSESFFCWSHDGSSLIFASHGNQKETCDQFFYSVAREGGEAVPLFGVAKIHPTVNTIRALDEKRYLLTAVYEPEYENPEGADVMIFEQIPFMANGKGYIGQRRTALAVFDVDTRELRRLTPPLMDVSRYVLNEQKTEALIVGVEYQGVKPVNNAVYKLDLVTGAIQCLSKGLLDVAFTFVHAAWLGDKVLVAGTDRKQGVCSNFKFYILGDGKLQCLTPDLDSSLGHSVVADSHYGCTDLGGAFFPRPDSKKLVYCALDLTKSCLYEMEDGQSKRLTDAFTVVDYCVGERIAFVAYEGLYPPELYLLEEGNTRRLTDFNRPLFSQLRLSQPVHVTVDNGQGWELDGWYMKPNCRNGEKCPTLLHIHGGPKAAFGDIYHHEMQCWAAKGYAVIYCNPRGGDGRGSAFQDIRGPYGDLDYHDLMVFTAWCVAHLDFVAASRLGVTGGAYGGYMTNWIVTQTDRFKAAVSQRGISNWVSKFGGCDIGYYYVEDQHLGTPWSHSENLWRESPLRYADTVKTPVLFIHSMEDFRCELNQSFQMFTALKVLGVESRLCVFKGENHELSRSGKPRNRLARLRFISDWFDKYLAIE